MSELIHFAHGNGFPSLCYKQMFELLGTHFDYCYIDKIGHNPVYPVNENWDFLVDEILESIESQANQPVIALGHSLGGVLSVMAAIKKPELFKKIIMLDSPLIGPFKSNMVKLAKSVGMIDKITPAARTKGRKDYWKSYEELWSYLRTRELFKTFTDQCLEDYIHYGVELKNNIYHLRFDKDIEYQIYRTMPHTLPLYEGQLLRPTTLIYGDKSKVVSSSDRRYMESRFHIRCIKTKGGHLFPMEHPKEVAEQIIKVIEDF